MRYYLKQAQLLVGFLTTSIALTGCSPAQTAVQTTGDSQSETEAATTKESPTKDTQNATIQTATEWSIESKIGTIVAERPEAARVLELVGIDYCCGGQKRLDEVAKGKDVDPNQLLAALMVVGAKAETNQNQDWNKASLSDLMHHIVTARRYAGCH